MMKFGHSSEAPGEDEVDNGRAARTARHFEIDVGEVEIGEDEVAGKHSRAKEEAYLRNQALIDVVLERGERLLEAHLQARDDRLVEAVASRLRIATASVSQPAAAEPLDSLSIAGRAKPGTLLSYQQSDSVRPSATATYAGARSMRRRRNTDGVPQEPGSTGEAAGPGQAALLQRRLMAVCSAGVEGDGVVSRGDMRPGDDAAQASISAMPPRRRRPLGQLRITGAVAGGNCPVAGWSSVAGGPAEPR
jgi:hypothetical protein